MSKKKKKKSNISIIDIYRSIRKEVPPPTKIIKKKRKEDYDWKKEYEKEETGDR